MYESPLEIIKAVGEVLREPLPFKQPLLIEHLTKLEALRFPLTEARVDLVKIRYEKRAQILHPKDKDLTELDRKVALQGHTALIERDYEFLCSLETLVAERLELGKQFLALV